MASRSALDPLVRELENVLAEHAAVGVAFSRTLADKRAHVERELLRALSPGFENERRWHVRVPTTLHGRLLTSAGRRPVAVINIGSGGACVELEGPPGPGSEIELELLTGPGTLGDMHSRFGYVVWVQGSRAGLCFETGTEPLDQHLMRFIVELLKRS